MKIKRFLRRRTEIVLKECVEIGAHIVVKLSDNFALMSLEQMREFD
jgi:hypothetical protein